MINRKEEQQLNLDLHLNFSKRIYKKELKHGIEKISVNRKILEK